jgi:hypothetical protein
MKFTKIGKKAAKADNKVLLKTSVPNHKTITGAIDIVGIARVAMAKGNIDFSKILEK